MEVDHLNKTYETFKLDEVSFEIPQGYVTGFIGRNGMGKTTTIKAMLGLIKYEGTISIDGKSAYDLQDIGIIMDDSFLAKDWTMNHVNQAMSIGYTHWNEDLFFSYLDRFKISRELKVKALSRGMKIKVMLAIALSHEAHLLIFDEPTSGLDPSMREEFKEIILDYMEDDQNTVLFSSHITQDLEDIADYILFIDNGKIVLSLPKEEFMDYFMILKTDKAQLDTIDPSLILGRKENKYSNELLVKKADFNTIPEGFIEDQVTLDQIMILYGRDQ